MTSKKTLVLGHQYTLDDVTGFRWYELPKHLNVADYHRLVMDFSVLERSPETNELVDVNLLPDRYDVGNLMFAGGEVIAVGRPDGQIGVGPSNRVNWWMPLGPRIESKQGTRIVDVDEEFNFYFSEVRHWTFHAVVQDVSPLISNTGSYAERIRPRASSFAGEATALARTIYGRAVGFRMNYRISLQTGGTVVAEQVFWLPPVTREEPRWAVERILAERYGLKLATTRPNWIQGYQLPNEADLREELEEVERELSKFREKRKEILRDLDHEEHFKQLLYESGELGLETVVREILEELGAEVYPPEARGREDGRLTDPFGRTGIFEVKGRTGSLKLDDVRQLEYWRTEAEEEGWSGKPIVFANLYCEQPPSERVDVFPPNSVRAAERYDQSLVRTEQLFQALVFKQDGKFDSPDFWDAIFETDGVCSYPTNELISGPDSERDA